LLCIGDAAHAMSPVGGVGINLAIQDAVAAANLLTASLKQGTPSVQTLRAVQARREFPTRVTQGIQVQIQERILNRVLNAREQIHAPALIRALLAIPFARRMAARIVGVGVRPEHVLVRKSAR
jgi:2-polyprenyl-6-methoxyphenol hydroxylase-like FAD-dependent oxidoreductase